MQLTYNYIGLILMGLLLSVASSKAQDAEFSQFYAAPTYLNPAMIGFAPAPRVHVNYRHQYPEFGNAFLTMAVGFDQHFSDYNSSIGVSVVADRAGDGGLYNTYQVNGLYAYQLQLSQNLFLKAGVQLGYFNQQIAWDQLVFGDMINPSNGSISGATLEEVPEQTSIHRFDIGGGLLAYNDRFYMGISAKHVNTPSLSFYDGDDLTNTLRIRSTFHVGHVFYMGADKFGKSKFYLSPNLVVINQGRFFQANTGMYAGKGIIYAGAWYRSAIRNSDAIILLFGIKAGVTRIGYSYDINLSPIGGTSAGAHEISLQFDFGQTEYVKDRVRNKNAATCPEIF